MISAKHMVMIRAALLAGMMCACGGDDMDAVDAGGNNADARSAELEGACPLDQRVGVFEIAHRELFSAVTSDGVADAVSPNTVFEEVHRDGDCVFMQKVNPFCDPPCPATQTCSNDDSCIARAQTRSVGAVTVTGLLAEVEMEVNGVGGYQDTSVPHPPFSPGSTIVLNATGADHAGFTLDGRGVDVLELPADNWIITRGEALAISWSAAGGPGSIYVSLNVDQHGNSPVTLYCDFADSGAASIPASMTDRLLEFGVSGFASAEIHRRTVDSTNTAQGCVELRVFSQRKPQLAVAGHDPE